MRERVGVEGVEGVERVDVVEGVDVVEVVESNNIQQGQYASIKVQHSLVMRHMPIR